MNKDKFIGSMLILFAIGVIGVTILFSIVFPAIDFNTYYVIGYFVLAGIISLAIFVVMLLLAWIGWTLVMTPNPEEIDLEDFDEDEKDEADEEKKEIK